jgi:nicotinamidase-related amidase
MDAAPTLSSIVRPLPELLAPARTALVVIDVQNDFAAAEGAMGRVGADLSAVDAAVDRIAALVAAARAKGVPVIFVRLQTSAETDSPAATERRARQGLADGIRPCRKGTWGEAYYRIAPQPGDVEIFKNRFSSFVNTPLDFVLRSRPGLDTLIACGLTTECCVETTVRDAFVRDYHIFVPHDAAAAYSRDLHDVSLKVLAIYFASIVSTEQILSCWQNA